MQALERFVEFIEKTRPGVALLLGRTEELEVCHVKGEMEAKKGLPKGGVNCSRPEKLGGEEMLWKISSSFGQGM